MPVTTGHASTRRFLRRASDRIPPTHRGSGRISRTGCVAGVADTAVVAPGTAFSAHTCRSPGSERASHAWKQASGGPSSRTQKSRGASARKGGPSWTRRPDQIRLEATRFGASLLGEEQRELWPSCCFSRRISSCGVRCAGVPSCCSDRLLWSRITGAEGSTPGIRLASD
jgi:hypothetical protein